MIKFALRLIAVTLLFTLTACGSAPARSPTAIDQAKKIDQAAHRAMRDGDLLRARELFRQNMLIQQSLENVPASAMATINLSSVVHKLGNDAEALDLLNTLLVDNAPSIPSDLRAAAAFRKGVILADNNKLGEAEAALLMAKTACGSSCALKAAMANLQARLMFAQGDYPGALETAKSAISSASEKDELAHAKRMAAASALALKQDEGALTYYHQALELDKELALSNRIQQDLSGISLALKNLGRLAESEAYALRADRVAVANKMLNNNLLKQPLP